MLLIKQTPNEREYCHWSSNHGAAAIITAPPAVAASAAPALVATKAEVAVPAAPAATLPITALAPPVTAPFTAAQPISSHAYPFSGDFILNEEPQHFLIFP